MPIPDFQTFMLPLLEALADGGEHHDFFDEDEG
jgi:hypothetical protein